MSLLSKPKSKLLTILILLAAIGTVTAAVFITFNPEAKLFFSREGPPADVNLVQTLFEFSSGWSNSIALGEMSDNVLSKNIAIRNNDAENITGRLIFELECDQGLLDGRDGIRELETALYTGPDGQTSTFNFDANMERVSPQVVRYIPSYGYTEFESMVDVLAHVELTFVDLAYGNYTLCAYVQEKST